MDTIAATPVAQSFSMGARDEVAGYAPFAPFADWVATPVGRSWSEFLADLDAIRNEVTPAELSRVLQIAVRSAALETGGIEGQYSTDRGVTYSVAVPAATWESDIESLGSDVRAYFDAQLAAYEAVLDVSTKRVEVSEAWLRALHEKICGAQATYQVMTAVGWQDHRLPLGAYKTEPNNVTRPDGCMHTYAPVDEVSGEMGRLMDEMRAGAFGSAHPVIQAAYAHDGLTVVHPFADGNGRTARALASVFLHRDAGIPLVVYSDQRERYYGALEAADWNPYGPLVTFIEQRAVDTMALIAQELRKAREPLADAVRNGLTELVVRDGLMAGQLEIIANRICDRARQEISAECTKLNFGPDFRHRWTGILGHWVWTNLGLAYRHVGTADRYYLIQYTQRLGNEDRPSSCIAIASGVADDPTDQFAFVLVDGFHPRTPVQKLRLEDVHPAITTVAEALIRGWVGEVLGNAWEELRAKWDRLRAEGSGT